MMQHPNVLFLNHNEITALAKKHSTPFYVYSSDVLTYYAQQALLFSGPYGTTVRYAVKANPHQQIIQLFDSLGLHFDASSGGEVTLLMSQGVQPSRIALNSQELPINLKELVTAGVLFTATSLHQLETYCTQFPGGRVGVRLNPGVGSGESNKVTTGGKSAGFGIWHEYIQEVKAIATEHNVTIDTLHTHIGAGTDPIIWQQVAKITLGLAEQIQTVTNVSLGGGFKVARMADESSADVPTIGEAIATLLKDFANRTHRQLHIEIEPGTYLTALSGLLVASVIDITDTGADGFTFLRINTGMNDILRPSLYGAQHPIWLIPQKTTDEAMQEYVIIGHNCESGDVLTPEKGNPEALAPRSLSRASIGDIVVIGGAGAYCASMRAHGYNSYASAKEVYIETNNCN